MPARPSAIPPAPSALRGRRRGSRPRCDASAASSRPAGIAAGRAFSSNWRISRLSRAALISASSSRRRRRMERSASSRSVRRILLTASRGPLGGKPSVRGKCKGSHGLHRRSLTALTGNLLSFQWPVALGRVFKTGAEAEPPQQVYCNPVSVCQRRDAQTGKHAVADVAQVRVRQGSSLILPRSFPVLSQAQPFQTMEADGADHVALCPPFRISPASRHLEGYLQLVMVRHHRVGRGLAQGNYGARSGTGLEFG